MKAINHDSNVFSRRVLMGTLAGSLMLAAASVSAAPDSSLDRAAISNSVAQGLVSARNEYRQDQQAFMRQNLGGAFAQAVALPQADSVVAETASEAVVTEPSVSPASVSVATEVSELPVAESGNSILEVFEGVVQAPRIDFGGLVIYIGNR